MRRGLLQKGTGIGVSLLLVLLIFSVLLPSTSSVMISPGIPNKSSFNIEETIIFQNITITIRGAEAITIQFLIFIIYNSTTYHKVAQVRFSLTGTKISETPHGAFEVMNVTNTSNLPYQSKGNYYGYDERTGYNVTGFHSGYGYGYGYDSPDLTILYTIKYTINKPGTYYAKLFVKAKKYTYISGETILFTVLPKIAKKHLSFSDTIPGGRLHQINNRDHRYLNASCGTKKFDINTIDLNSLTFSFDRGEKNKLKPPFL